MSKFLSPENLLFLGKGEIGEEFLLSFNREQQKERLSFNFVL